jgi:hypothetical protein
MSTELSSFVDKDSVIIYPEIVNFTDGSGNKTENLKANSLTTYAATSFYFERPSIAILQGSTGTSTLAAYQNLVNSLNTYKTANAATLDIKIISMNLVNWGASSFSYIAVVSVFRI